MHNMGKDWEVIFHDEFEPEFESFDEELQDELLAHALLLRDYGPILGRPTVDTLKGSRHANMKELRFDWGGGSWRVAFAFDPRRRAILIAGGDKAGVEKKRFYRKLIADADKRFDGHLASLGVKRGRRRGKGTVHDKRS